MGEEKRTLSCTDCGVLNCHKRNASYPEFCLTEKLTDEDIAETTALYEDEENRKVSVISAEIEGEFYGKYTRVDEIIEFAKRMGYKKIGIATCVGLIEESRIFARILRKNGFDVYSAVCKVGSFNKTDIGLDEKYTCVTGNVMCNPILQAKLLNKAGTDLNVVIGLCVGHDSLFYKYSEALSTTLVTKDRVLAHNPVGALYQVKAYYKRLLDDYGKLSIKKDASVRRCHQKEDDIRLVGASFWINAIWINQQFFWILAVMNCSNSSAVPLVKPFLSMTT